MSAELLFKRAMVFEGTGRPGFVADVAVENGRILEVGDLAGLPAARVVNGEGRALCPGFVDMHGHSDYFLLILPSAESKLKQGITLEVGGNCGYSAAPALMGGAVAAVAERAPWRGADNVLVPLAVGGALSMLGLR